MEVVMASKLYVVVVRATKSCPTLCDLMDCSLPGSSVSGISQARILEWVAMPSFRGSFWPRDQIHVFLSPALAGWFFTARATMCLYVMVTEDSGREQTLGLGWSKRGAEGATFKETLTPRHQLCLERSWEMSASLSAGPAGITSREALTLRVESVG